MIKTKSMDLTTGPITKNLIIYAIPFIFASLLQILFHMADIAIVGIFVSDDAVAAVGANTSLTNLLVNFFVGFSVGAGVVLAKNVGAKDSESAKKTVGTAIFLSLIASVVLVAIGVPMARTFLVWMSCDESIIGLATTYLRIYFLGIPLAMLYNFSASILRASGDTRRPLTYLIIGGVANVILNLFFVLVLDMTVAGVAIATTASNGICAVLCVGTLLREKGYASLQLSEIKIHVKQLLEIVKIGLPSGLQSVAFNIANVLIQSTVNSFGAAGMSANTAAGQFDSMVYTVGNAIAMSVMTFVGQNIGATNTKRVKQSIVSGVIVGSITTFALGVTFAIFSPFLCGLIVSGEEVIAMAAVRLTIMGSTYFLCCIMEVFANAIRAMGRPVFSLVVSVLCATVFRVALLKVAFAILPEFWVIYCTWPASWALAIVIYSVLTPRVFKMMKADMYRKHLNMSEV